MNILVTGCFGFIGSNLVPKLLWEGHNVIGFDTLVNAAEDASHRMKENSGDRWGNFKFFRIDIREYASMYAICIHENIEMVIHLAALGSVPRSFMMPMDFIDVNEKGFASIAYLASSLLTVKRVVYASSSSIYGETQTFKKTEGREGQPKSPYAISKKQNEMFAKVWSRQVGLEFVGLRFFNVYGPGQSAFSAYSAVIPKFICEEKPTVHGDGTTARDFTFVDDVCKAITLSMKAALPSLHVAVNVGTGRSTTLNQLLDMLRKKHLATYGPGRECDVSFSVADTNYAEKTIGFIAEVGIEEGLKRTRKYFDGVTVGKPETEVSVSERT